MRKRAAAVLDGRDRGQVQDNLKGVKPLLPLDALHADGQGQQRKSSRGWKDPMGLRQSCCYMLWAPEVCTAMLTFGACFANCFPALYNIP